MQIVMRLLLAAAIISKLYYYVFQVTATFIETNNVSRVYYCCIYSIKN